MIATLPAAGFEARSPVPEQSCSQRGRTAPRRSSPRLPAARYGCGGSRRRSESERPPPALRRTAAAPRLAEPGESGAPSCVARGPRSTRRGEALPRPRRSPPGALPAAGSAPLRSSLTCSRRCPRSGRGTPIAHAGTAVPSPLLPLRPSLGRGRRMTAGTPRAAPPPIAARSRALCPALALECAPPPDGRRGGGRGGSSPAHARALRPPHALKPRLLPAPPPIGFAGSVPGDRELPIGRSRCRATERPGPAPRRACRLPPPAGGRGRGRRGALALVGLGWDGLPATSNRWGGGKEHGSPSAAVGPEPSLSGAPLGASAAPPPRFKSQDAAARWR